MGASLQQTPAAGTGLVEEVEPCDVMVVVYMGRCAVREAHNGLL